MTTADIERRTALWIRDHQLVRPGERVVVALSGGADSVCLTEILLRLSAELEITLHAAHYNHRLRGAESDRDEAFVRALCLERRLPLTCGAGDVAAEAERLGRGVEETARHMRYAFLDETMTEVGGHRIATAHHADDNTETILLNLVRGAGLRGLSGIPVRRDRIIRPILALERREIEDYLAALGTDYVEDSTNRDPAYRRNALRHEIVPRLLAYNPSLHRTLLRQSDILRRDGRYLDDLAREAFDRLASRDGAELSFSKAELEALDPALAYRVAALALESAGAPGGDGHIRQALALLASGSPSAETHVGGGVAVRRTYDRLVFSARSAGAPPFLPVTLPGCGTVELPRAGLRLHIGRVRPKIHGSFKTFLFKSEAICGKITVRPRMAGDKIRPAGRGVTKPVKKWMIEEKVPARRRDDLPVLADERGILAVLPLGLDERVRPGPGDHTLTITVEEIPCTET